MLTVAHVTLEVLLSLIPPFVLADSLPAMWRPSLLSGFSNPNELLDLSDLMDGPGGQTAARRGFHPKHQTSTGVYHEPTEAAHDPCNKL